MSNDDIQSTMQFILEQQAQFAANIQKLEEVQLRDSPRVQRLEVAFVQMVELARSVDERLDRMAASQERLEHAQATTSEQLAQLAAAQRETERRLGELATTQRTTEQRVAELATAQRTTEQRVAELAVAQHETQTRIGEMAGSVQALAQGQQATTEVFGNVVRLLEQIVRGEGR